MTKERERLDPGAKEKINPEIGFETKNHETENGDGHIAPRAVSPEKARTERRTFYYSALEAELSRRLRSRTEEEAWKSLLSFLYGGSGERASADTEDNRDKCSVFAEERA